MKMASKFMRCVVLYYGGGGLAYGLELMTYDRRSLYSWISFA